MAEIKWIKKYEKKVRVIPSPPKPQTNGDLIRAMTDEELAKEMSVRLSEDCLMCPVLKNDCPVWESKDIECETAMLEWLKKDAEP